MNNHHFHLINEDCIRSADSGHNDFYESYISSFDKDDQASGSELESNTNHHPHYHHHQQQYQDHQRRKPKHIRHLFERKASRGFYALPGDTNNKNQLAMLALATPNNMDYRNIGKNGLKVPLLGFSAWNSFSQNMSEETADELVTMAYENGINYFDTGDAFNNGQSEIVLGKILKRKSWPRSSYVVSSKIFWKAGPSSHLGEGLSRKFIIEAVEASLRRLQLRYIDLLVINKLDAMCPMEEIVRTMSYLINNGIIFYWGTSRFSPMHISEAFSIARQFNCPPPICEQMEYHMLFRDKMELQMLELFHKSGIGCIVWSPSSMQNDDGIQLITRKVNAYETKHFLTVKYPKLVKLCEQIGCDLVQLSLAWCLQNENVNCVLIAATSVHELRKKLDSIKYYSLLSLEMNDDIDRILANNPVLKRPVKKNPSITVDIATDDV